MRWHRIQALLLKYWYISLNSTERFFDLVYWPIIGMVVFGFTTSYIEGASDFHEIFVFLLGGLMMWILLERVQQDISIFILEDFWSHNIANSFITPVKESEIFASVAIIGLIRSVISFALMFCLAFFLYNFNVLNGGLLSLLFIIPLLIFGCGLGIMIAGLIFRWGMKIQIFAWSITYLLQPTATVYYPLSTLPIVLQKIAHLTPLMYVFEGYRLSYTGNFSVWHFSWGLGLAVGYFIICYLIFLKSIKASKKTGQLAKH